MTSAGYPGIFPGGLTTGFNNIGAVQKYRPSAGYPGVFPAALTTGYMNTGAAQRDSGLVANGAITENRDIAAGTSGLASAISASGAFTENGDATNGIGFVDGAPSRIVDLSTFVSEFTYSRPDSVTCATRIDSAGELRLVAASTTPLDYTWGDGAYLSEASRANVCTNFNMTPAATTGLTPTGTVTIGLVTDVAELTAAKIRNAASGNVFQVTGGIAGGTLIISGGVGVIGQCAASLYAREVAGTGASFGITPTPTILAISGSSYRRYRAQNLTSTATTNTIVITIPPNVAINFILNQLEAGQNCTSVIRVDGVSRTRAATSLVRTDMAAQTWFNRTSGGMLAEVTPQGDTGQPASEFIAFASSTGSFPLEAYYLYTTPNGYKLSGAARGNNITSAIGVPDTGFWSDTKISMGMTWENNVETTTIIGPASFKTVNLTYTVGAITNLTLGSSPALTSQFNGWIHTMTFYNDRPTLPQATIFMLGNNVGFSERGVLLAGQSNAENMGQGTSSTGFRNYGEQAFRQTAGEILGNSSRNWYINGAFGGSFIVAWQGSGIAIVRCKAVIEGYLQAGGIIDAIQWDQGESDVGQTQAFLYTAWLGIFNDLRDYIFSIAGYRPPVFIVPLGKYKFPSTYNNTTNNGAIAMRAAQRQLAAQNPSFIKITMEKFQQPLVDDIVHLTDDGYFDHGINCARFIYQDLGYSVSGGVYGPSITGIVGSGINLLVTCAQDVGATDFSTTSLTTQGWVFQQNSNSLTPIAVTAVTYVSPTQMIVTLASNPGAGTHTVYYGDDLLWPAIQADLIRDNSPYRLALRQFITTLTYGAGGTITENPDSVVGDADLIFYAFGSFTENRDQAVGIVGVTLASGNVIEHEDIVEGYGLGFSNPIQLIGYSKSIINLKGYIVG